MPSLPLVTGCVLKCSFGMAPSAFVSTPKPGAPMILGALPGATIEEIVPMMNIMPFGMCQSMANPQVAAATSAAMGVLTPMPCVPVTSSPWAPPAVTPMNNFLPMATVQSKCVCAWGGMIEVITPIAGPAQAT